MQPFLMAIDSEELEKKLAGLEVKVSKILDIISGNDLDKNDNGMVGNIKNHDDRISNLEKWKDRFVYTVIGMGIPASVGIVEILRKIISK